MAATSSTTEFETVDVEVADGLATVTLNRPDALNALNMQMKEELAENNMPWEADKVVPFAAESVELDFQILDPAGEGLQMEVLLVAAKRELVEHKLALLSDVGLDASVATAFPEAHVTVRRDA